MSEFDELSRKIDSGTATIGIIGLGYVGLPLAVAAARAGYKVVGFDVDERKIHAITGGESYVAAVRDDDLRTFVHQGKLGATTDMLRLGEVDVVIICVPTPVSINRQPDLSFVRGAVEAVAATLRPGQLVVLESTTWPGTTNEVVRGILATRKELTFDEDYFVAFSPEREDPGNESFHTVTIPKVVGGTSARSADLAKSLYSRVVQIVIPVSSATVAEAVKITENVFRSVNIALVNELKRIYGAMGIDIWEVIDAAKSKPFGYMAFYPGPGVGGHCIPIDPFYLSWKAHEYGQAAEFIDLASRVNASMPAFVVNQLSLALDKQQGSGLRDRRILVVGVAYKKNVPDVRESPALDILELLHERGARVAYHDPHVPTLHDHEAGDFGVLDSAEITPDTFDAAIIVTDHDAIDYERLVRCVPIITDTRNVLRRRELEAAHYVVG